MTARQATWLAVLGCVLAVARCGGEPQRPDLLVSTSDSAGIPVYSLASIPPWDAPAFAWTLELERAVATDRPGSGRAPLLYRPEGYARMPDGTLVVLDSWERRLAVIPPDRDTVMARFAPTGQGPGEIWSSNAVLWPADDTSVWVLDPGNQRLDRFALSGALLEESPVVVGGSAGFVLQDPVTHAPWFWKVFFEDYEHRTLTDSVGRLDPEAARVHFIAALPPRVEARVTSTAPIPLFAPRSWFAPIGAGGVVVGRSDRARFTYVSDAGEPVAVIEAPMEPAPVPESDEPGILEEFHEEAGPGSAAAGTRIADHYPVWDLLWPLGDSLFALQQSRRSTPLGEPPIPSGQLVWRIFAVDGRYLGAAILPPGFAQPYWIEGERVIGTRRDSLGVATIEAYRLKRPAG